MPLFLSEAQLSFLLLISSLTSTLQDFPNLSISSNRATRKAMGATRIFRKLPKVKPFQLSMVCSKPVPLQRCQLHTTSVCSTDGVYKALTEMRVKTPWIEALRKQREHGIDPTTKSDTPATPLDLDLRPKRMSDSYHRVVYNPNGQFCAY